MKDIEKDIYDLRIKILTQNNYYTRELERIIYKIKNDFGHINVRYLNVEECDKIRALYNYIRDLNFKNIYNDSIVVLEADNLKEKIKEKKIKNHLKVVKE